MAKKTEDFSYHQGNTGKHLDNLMKALQNPPKDTKKKGKK